MNNYTWDFLTLLPECNNIDIYKDVGMIPYTLAKEYGMHTAVASSNMDENAGDQLDMTSVPMDILHLKQKNRFVAGVFFLLKNARRIRVLNLYHLGKVVILWSILYKLLNPKGQIYLKLDMNLMYCDRLDRDTGFCSEFKKCINRVDYVSTESGAIKRRIEKYADKELQLIYNGYSDSGYAPDSTDKEELFLTVGRLGTKEKATDTLLEAFAKSSSEHCWKLKLIGSIEEKFKPYIEEYFNRYPELKDRIIFGDFISDKKTLYSEYDKARVFVLPSRWEGFPLVFPEALSRGCRIIGTRMIPPMEEITRGGEFGETVSVDDIEELSEALIKMTKIEYSERDYKEIFKYADENFSWRAITGKLYRIIYK